MKHISCQIPTGNGTSNTLGVLITDGDFGEKGREHVLVIQKNLQPPGGTVRPDQLTLIKTSAGPQPTALPFEVRNTHCRQGLFSYDIVFL